MTAENSSTPTRSTARKKAVITHDTEPRPRRRLPDMEDIEGQPALIAQPLEPISEFQILDQVHRADDHVVVPASIIIVQVHIIKFAVAREQRGGLGDIFPGGESMADIHQHPDPVQYLEKQEGFSSDGHKTMGARFLELVFHQHSHLAVILLGAGSQSVAEPFPDLDVVSLKGIIKPVPGHTST